MNLSEKIITLKTKIQKIEIEYEKQENEILNNIRENGFLSPGINIEGRFLQELISAKVEKTTALNNQISWEINEYILELSKVLIENNINHPIYDYNLSFENKNDINLSRTEFDKVLTFFLENLNPSLYSVKSLLYKKPNFFNLKDVVIESGNRPVYLSLVRESIRILKYYNLYDKNAAITFLGLEVKGLINDIINEEKNNPYKKDSWLNEDFLKSLLRDLFYKKFRNELDGLMDLKDSELDKRQRVLKDIFFKCKN